MTGARGLRDGNCHLGRQSAIFVEEREGEFYSCPAGFIDSMPTSERQYQSFEFFNNVYMAGAAPKRRAS
jgi:hypothetical protein